MKRKPPQLKKTNKIWNKPPFGGLVCYNDLMNKLIEYLKNDWQKKSVIVGSALIVLSSATVLLSMVIRRGEVANAPEINDNVNATLPLPKVFKDLYAVSLDNHIDARPVSGLSKAVLVYELPVEGNITRYLGVFERGTEVDEIGAVRSARPYFLDLIAELGPSLFLHFGGSPDSLEKIASTPFLREANRDGMGNAGENYWRDTGRDMPHNAYTSSDEVEKMFASRTGEARAVSTWLMAADPDIDLRGQDDVFTVPISNSANYQPEWRYSRESNIYSRYIRDKQEFDREKNAIETKNVIVMDVAVKMLDEIGRLQVDLVGSGKATVYRNGEKIDAAWRNETGGAVTRFYADDGSEIVLTSGSVWVEVVKK